MQVYLVTFGERVVKELISGHGYDLSNMYYVILKCKMCC